MPLNKRLHPTVIHELIEEVKKRDYMWDPEHPEYNDRKILADTWMEIAAKMKKPEIILRSKWKNLRDLFKKEVKKGNLTSAEQYKGTWRFFHKLSFLYKPDCNYYEETPAQPECFVKFEPVLDYKNEEVEIEEGTRRRSSDEDNLSISKRFKNGDDNFDMLFLKSLLPFFEALSPVRKLIVRNKIQKLLLDEITKMDNDSILGE